MNKKSLGYKRKYFGDINNVTNFCWLGFEPRPLLHFQGKNYVAHSGHEPMTLPRFSPFYRLRHQFTDNQYHFNFYFTSF